MLPKPRRALAERVSERGMNSKVWDTANGKVFRATMLPIHRPDNYGAWKSGQKHDWVDVDHKPVQAGVKFGVPDAWYTLDFDPTTLILTATWLDGGVVEVDLQLAPHPKMRVEIIDASVWLRDVRPGLDIEARFSAATFEFFKHVKTAQAPHTIDWVIRWKSADYDLRPALLRGMAFDDARFRAELLLSVSPERQVADGFTEVDYSEVLTGKTVAVIRNPSSGWARDAVYPIVIDATFGPTDIAADADDGYEHIGGADWINHYGNNWYIGFLNAGNTNHGGFRWDSITVPKDATINSASIQYFIEFKSNTTTGDVKADDVADAVGWSDSSRPSQIAQTTATDTFSINSVGSQSTSIANVVQEIVDRADWVSGNAMRFAFLKTVTSLNWCQGIDSSDTGEDIPTLTIDYTAAAGGLSIPVAMNSYRQRQKAAA